MDNVFLIVDEEKSFCDYLLKRTVIKKSNTETKKYDDIDSMFTSSIFDLFDTNENEIKILYLDNKKSIKEKLNNIIKDEKKIINNLKSNEKYVFVLSGDTESSLKKAINELKKTNINFEIISPFVNDNKNKKSFIIKEFEKNGLNKKTIQYLLQFYVTGKKPNYYFYIPILNTTYDDKDFVNDLNNSKDDEELKQHINSFIPNFSKEIVSLWDWKNAFNEKSFSEFSKQMMKVFNNHSNLLVYRNIYNDMCSLYREKVTNNYSWHRKAYDRKISLEKVQKIIDTSRTFHNNVLFNNKMSSDSSLFIVTLYSIINENK